MILFSSHSAESQTINLKKKITVIAKNKELALVLDEIQDKSGLKFSYNTQTINPSESVTLIARKKSVENIFRILFSDLNIQYTIVDKHIVLKKKHSLKKKEVVKKDIKPKKFTISGYIKNQEDGEVLIGATVSIHNSYFGTVTNEFGFFSLQMPEGDYLLKVSYIGFKDIFKEIDLKKDLFISEKMEIDESEIEIVVVSEEEKTDIIEKSVLKQVKLNGNMINSDVGLAGEADVVKSIQSVPGITAYGDGSVLFYVRGGGKDQNLIMIDDAPVYNPSHLFGFFSAISPDIVNDMKIWKNSFSVKFGGRISSVIDIRTKDGNLNKWGFSGKLSPFTGSYTVDGPLKKEKSSIIFNARTSYLNRFLSETDNEIGFYDLHFKFNSKLNRKNRLFFSFYSGKDRFVMKVPAFGTSALTWQNSALSLRWNKLYSDKLFSNLTLHASKYDYYLYYSIEDNFYWNSFISDLSAKYDFSWYINPTHKIDFGMNYKIYVFNPGNLNNDFFERSIYTGSVIETVMYFGHQMKLSDRLSMNYGARLVQWNNAGPARVFEFDDQFNVIDTIDYENGVFNSFLNIEPRISFDYIIAEDLIAKISYDRHVQHLQLLSNSVSPFTTMDVWMPAGPNIKPEKSHQIVLGINKIFAEFDLSAEVYYKKIDDLIDYDDHSNMLLNPYIEGELRIGEGYGYGAEFSFQKKKGNFTFYSSYTWSRIIAQVNGINNNKEFPERHDKPHNVSINLSWATAGRWTLSASWVYSSGMRFSSPTGFYNYSGYTIPIYEYKNNDKLPDYHRMDLSAKLRLNKNLNARYRHDLTFSIFNFYNRQNYVAVNFNKIETDQGEFYVPADLIADYQLLSTSRYLIGFIPSIAYSFKFR